MKYKDFTDFLNAKFYKDNPTTLDDEWPDMYSDWLSDQDSDTLVKYADEYIEALKKRVEDLENCINRIANRCRSGSYDSILQDAEAALNEKP